jgi:glutathione S-transferase
MIHFYCGSGSPYAWRAWLALEHKALPYELHMMSFSGGDLRSDAFRAINPRGKVPAILDGTFRLAESAAIVEYLDDAYPDAGERLFPPDVQARATARRMIRDADEYLAHAMETLVEQVLFTAADKADPALIAAGREGVMAELGVLEHGGGAPFMMGGTVGAVDFTLYPMVALLLRMEARKRPDLRIGEALGPRLRAWMTHMEGLPCFERTYPPHWRTA